MAVLLAMFRKDLLKLLLDYPMSVNEIAREVRVTVKEVHDDLRHLLKSLCHTEYEMIVTPAHCRKCGFEFDADKLTKPSKCPNCRATWIQEPLVEIRRRREG